jgi:hypothetical protein
VLLAEAVAFRVDVVLRRGEQRVGVVEHLEVEGQDRLGEEILVVGSPVAREALTSAAANQAPSCMVSSASPWTHWSNCPLRLVSKYS